MSTKPGQGQTAPDDRRQGSRRARRRDAPVQRVRVKQSTHWPTASIIGSKFELFATDVDESILFYVALGFKVADRKDDNYTTLRTGSTVVALSPAPSWLPLRWFRFLRYPPLGTEIVLYTDRLEDLRAAVAAAGYSPGEIALRAWGDRDFRVTDCDGYYVRVSEGQAVPEPE